VALNKEQKNKGGRPPIEIDMLEVEKLANLGCTHQEISDYYGCTVKTLTSKEGFYQFYKKGFSSAKMSLRREQIRNALNGNTAMQIFLGKQYLGQADVPDEQRKVWEAQKKSIEVQTEAVRIQNEINKEKLRLLRNAETTTLDKLDQILDNLLLQAAIGQDSEISRKIDEVEDS